MIREKLAGEIVAFFFASLSVKVFIFGFLICFLIALFWLWYPIRSWKDLKSIKDAWLFAFIMAFPSTVGIWVIFKVGQSIFKSCP